MGKRRYPGAEMEILARLSKSKQALSQQDLKIMTGLCPSVVSETLSRLCELGFVQPLLGDERCKKYKVTVWGELVLLLKNCLVKNYKAGLIPSQSLSKSMIRGYNPFKDEFYEFTISSDDNLLKKIEKRIDETKKFIKVVERKTGIEECEIKMPLLGEHSALNALVVSHKVSDAIRVKLIKVKSSEETLKAILNEKLDLALLMISLETLMESHKDIDNLLIMPLDHDYMRVGPAGVEIWRSPSTNVFSYFHSAQRAQAANKLREVFSNIELSETNDELSLDPREGFLVASSARATFVELLAQRKGMTKGRRLAYFSPLFTVVRKDFLERNPSVMRVINNSHHYIQYARETSFNRLAFRAAEMGVLRLMSNLIKDPRSSNYLKLEFGDFFLLWTKCFTNKAKELFNRPGLNE